ncbi:hypothetical protein TNCV_362101 [Trichonephila clavipes]|nr:hypothetical protein TNCV_362101 [Trichonephila clavipes]
MSVPTSSFLSDNVVQHVLESLVPSLNPFPSGWYGVEKRGQAPKIFKNSCVKLAVKFVPLSITITSGIPVLLNISSSASHLLLAVSDLSRIASGHLECWSIKQSMYLCPCDDTGSAGPIKSMFTTCNGYSGRDTGVIGILSTERITFLS